MTSAADGTPSDRQPILPAVLLASAQRQGLELTTEAADCDESGLDFVVVHARDANGTPWIVRRPRRASVLEAARHEAAPSTPFLTSLAEALAALQAIPIEAAREAGVKVSSLADERAWLRDCMQKTREVLAPSQALWQR